MEEQSEKNMDISRDVSQVSVMKEGGIDEQGEHNAVEESKDTEAARSTPDEHVTDSVPVSGSVEGEGIIIGDPAIADSHCNDKNTDVESVDMSGKSGDQGSIIVESSVLQSVSDSTKSAEATELSKRSSPVKDDSQSRDSTKSPPIQKDVVLLEEESESNIDNGEVKELPSGGLEYEEISDSDFEDPDREPETVISEDTTIQSEDTSEPQSKNVDTVITDVRQGVKESSVSCEGANDAEKMSEVECENVKDSVADTDSKISQDDVNEVSIMESENTSESAVDLEQNNTDEVAVMESENISEPAADTEQNKTDEVTVMESETISEPAVGAEQNKTDEVTVMESENISEPAADTEQNKADEVTVMESETISEPAIDTEQNNADEVAVMESENISEPAVDTEQTEDEAMDVDETSITEIPPTEDVVKESKTNDSVDAVVPENVNDNVNEPTESVTEGMVIGDVGEITESGDAAPCHETDKNDVGVVDIQDESLKSSDSEPASSSTIQKKSDCSTESTSGQGQDEEMVLPEEGASSGNAKENDLIPARESHASEVDEMGKIEIVDCKTIDSGAPEEVTSDDESCQIIESIESSKQPTEDPLATAESTKERESEDNKKTDEDDLSDSEIAEEKDENNSDQDSISIDEPAELCAVILEEDNEETENNDAKKTNLEDQSEESMDKDNDDHVEASDHSSQEKDPFAATEEAKDKSDDQTPVSSGEEQPMEVDESDNSGRSVLRNVLLKEQDDGLSVNSESGKEKPADKAVNEAHEKSDSSGEMITGDKQPREVLLQPDDDEEICIIPDTMPRLPNNVDKGDGERSKITTKGFATLSSSTVEKPEDDNLKDTAAASSAQDVNAETSSKEESPRRTPGRPQRQAAKKAETQIKELAESDGSDTELGRGDAIDEPKHVCHYCCRLRVCKFQLCEGERPKYFCGQDCFNCYKKNLKKPSDEVSANKSKSDVDQVFTRKCAQCTGAISGDEKNLSWETMDFCDEECLSKYQKVLGSQCANCKGSVAQTSLGKYCVRFGYDVKQFCCSGCLEEFKKGLKVCSYCQKDISMGAEGFLAPVGDKGQFKDFCTQSCMEKYDQMSNQQPPPVVVHHCAVCNNEKVVSVEVIHNKMVNKLCSEPCYAAFKFVNGVVADKCFMCKKYFDKKEVDNFAVYSEETVHHFCCKMCMNVYILGNRKIVPCQWCKVKKYNFDMIKRTLNNGQVLLVCSLNCMTLYHVSMSAITSKRVKCDMCNTVSQAQYHLTMSDATVRNFCTYQCVMQFQGQYSKTGNLIPESAPVPTGAPKRYLPKRTGLNENSTETSPPTKNGGAMPVISSVLSLAPNGQAANNASITPRPATLKVNNNITSMSSKGSQIVYKQQVILRPTPPKTVRNKSIICRPYVHTKGVSCRPSTSTKETQTETSAQTPTLIPVPVPIYVPAPMAMYSLPCPYALPFPLPIPVPIFIPTTRNSYKGIMKEIKRIQEKIPADPFEAEMLMMAEIVAGEKKAENTDSDSDEGGNDAENNEEPGDTSAPTEERFSPEAVDTSNTEEMLQMALKMASELEEPADLEAALTPTTITPQSQPPAEPTDTTESEDDPEPAAVNAEPRATRSKKRATRSRPASSGSAAKRRRVSSSAEAPLLPPPDAPQPRQPEQEKPDANMCLKFTFGVNAWKQWVLAKNAELEKAAASNRKLKLFKPEILQLTADELNYSLCLFVKEVRRPNLVEYAPDTIYYLCLGIQQYLYENGRIDNIFTDPYYEKFTECLDEVARKFASLYSDAAYIVTRVEEEHLWESRQLGAHSPHVLLSTLLFFNTKHFNLTTVDEHMQLSFSHIMKHWKRNPNQPGASKTPGSRNVLLRFYPPQSALDANSKKKKVYEQQENEENPIRCPVKLYEFYLSKCPESVKTRNDVFYLLPERSCVPDSPVWYSTMALGKEPLVKMLNRVRMVKEINFALMTS